MSGATVGLYGKLPSRGDFVRLGLRRDFTDPWDMWWQAGLAGAERIAGPAWVASWLEAPVWQFLLAAGICGAAPVLGVFLPSVDRVGRYFPLTLAGVGAAWDEDFLVACEEAGRAALETDLSPETVAGRLPLPLNGGSGAAGCRFRTEGGRRVAARELRLTGLPSLAGLTGMLDDAWQDGLPDGAP